VAPQVGDEGGHGLGWFEVTEVRLAVLAAAFREASPEGQLVLPGLRVLAVEVHDVLLSIVVCALSGGEVLGSVVDPRTQRYASQFHELVEEPTDLLSLVFRRRGFGGRGALPVASVSLIRASNGEATITNLSFSFTVSRLRNPGTSDGEGGRLPRKMHTSGDAASLAKGEPMSGKRACTRTR
jgi:hypothetical protein